MKYNTALACCKDNREEIIEVYNEAERTFSLKEFMEVVLEEMEKVVSAQGYVCYGDLSVRYDDMLDRAMTVSSAKTYQYLYEQNQARKKYL